MDPSQVLASQGYKEVQTWRRSCEVDKRQAEQRVKNLAVSEEKHLKTFEQKLSHMHVRV